MAQAAAVQGAELPALPLDPCLQQMVRMAATQPALQGMAPAAAREFTSARFAQATGTAQVHSVQDRNIPGPAGALRIRVYRPLVAIGSLPVTVYFHGGGFVVMDLDTHDGVCRQLCSFSRSVVVSVDYRLAPEFPFPAAADDAFAALQWVAGHASDIGADAQAIAVAGDSAGGNLATVAALRARDEGGPVLKAQLLFYPVVDFTGRTRWPSRSAFAEGYGMTAATLDWFMTQYLPEPRHRTHAHASPLAADLTGLPPTAMVTAGYDLLRDEGEAYAARLADAGVPVWLRRHDALNHAFLHWTDGVPGALDALQQAGAWLQGALRQPGRHASSIGPPYTLRKVSPRS